MTGLTSATETVTDTNTTYSLNVSGTGDNANKVGLVAGGSGSGTTWYTIPYAANAGTAASANSVAWANVSGHDAGVDADLGINTTSGDTTKFLNARGGWAVPPSGLPAVTAADNGKVLTVVNGAWAATTQGTYRGGYHYIASTYSITISLTNPSTPEYFSSCSILELITDHKDGVGSYDDY